MQDIVFPNKNEEEYIEIAQKLGIKELVFIYKKPEDFYKGKNKFPTTNALLVSPNHVQKAKNKGALAICAGIREAIERSADIVYDFEQEEKKDKTHYRRSGLNQVLCIPSGWGCITTRSISRARPKRPEIGDSSESTPTRAHKPYP